MHNSHRCRDCPHCTGVKELRARAQRAGMRRGGKTKRPVSMWAGTRGGVDKCTGGDRLISPFPVICIVLENLD